ncbi:flavin reductase family protein [Nocardiopsis halophila]|uniref:flavin reductase family protein n=1 Tax=Nocardiopsis halophila TaxID=141692 RepID=UPI00034AD22D|nr:flavin reductase family protein [Nocardiopsis halophila]
MDPSDFTRGMAAVPGPVTVATTVTGAGARSGFTASSFVSVSLDPPLVLLCIDQGASTYQAFADADRFLVNVLAEGQEAVALRFATSGIDRFAAGDMRPCEGGLPGLPEAALRVSCTRHALVGAGDHGILVGRVEEIRDGRRPPLVYHRRSFTRPAPLPRPEEQLLSALHLTDW